MRREKCALCGRYYPVPGMSTAADECPGLPCWTAALNRMAGVGFTDKNTETETQDG